MAVYATLVLGILGAPPVRKRERALGLRSSHVDVRGGSPPGYWKKTLEPKSPQLRHIPSMIHGSLIGFESHSFMKGNYALWERAVAKATDQWVQDGARAFRTSQTHLRCAKCQGCARQGFLAQGSLMLRQLCKPIAVGMIWPLLHSFIFYQNRDA